MLNRAVQRDASPSQTSFFLASKMRVSAEALPVMFRGIVRREFVERQNI